MTIAIAVKVYDGLVFATDSAYVTHALVGGKPQFLNATQNATKQIQLHAGLPIGMVMWGTGVLGRVSVHTLAQTLRARLMGEDPTHTDWALDPDSYTLEQVSRFAQEFFFEEVYKANRDPAIKLGLWIGGYSAGEDTPELWSTGIDLDRGIEPTIARSHEECGLDWQGEAVAVPRMVLGVGRELFVTLQQSGMSPHQAENTVSLAKNNAQLLLAPPSMPIQDAVDLAVYLAEAEAQMARFMPGQALTGGPIDVAAITRHEGFTWFQRKPFADRSLNTPYTWPQPPAPAPESTPEPAKKKRSRKKKSKKKNT